MQYTPFLRTFMLLLAIIRPFGSHCQEDHQLKYDDVRNGTFYFFDRNSDKQETFVRKGALQKENIPKDRETLSWEVNWINDSTYSLKYESGAENRPESTQKFLAKHIVVVQILQVRENYLVFRSALDKVTNPAIATDTMWIKQRQSTHGKSFTNPNADSILAGKTRTMDSLEASYAKLYIFRPAKTLNSLKNYDLVVNGQPIFLITNGCRKILKIPKAGSYRISAKVDGPEQVVTLDVKPGESYYLQCMITWGITSHPILQILDKVSGKQAFETEEKGGFMNRVSD